MILSLAETNRNIKIIQINVEKEIKDRLFSYSIVKDATAMITHKNGSVIILSVDGGLYAISKNITDNIVVEYA